MAEFQPVLQIIEQARTFGFSQLANGVKLYGHVPHIAPEAWLHQIYPALSEQDVISLEEKLGGEFPADFRDFLFCANGIGLFSDSLSIYGKRTSFARSGDEAWQPFCIITANTLDRPSSAKPWQIIIGSYRTDGSLLSLDSRNATVIKTKGRSKKIMNQWPGFWQMLQSESKHLSTLFDAQGQKKTDWEQ